MNSAGIGTNFKSATSVIWKFLWPIRLYIRHAPWGRGKSFLARAFLNPIIPKEGSFTAVLQDGTALCLQYSDIISRTILVEGDFEAHERSVLVSAVTAGSSVIEVGANIGVFSLAMAKKVEPNGQVIALEPLQSNADKLLRNAELNGVTNILVEVAAASDNDGESLFHIADDPAFHSILSLSNDLVAEVGRSMVDTVKLDTLWERLHRPTISVVKIDVEGAEMAVLLGADALLRSCKPLLLLEANTPQALERQKSHLANYGYEVTQPAGFHPWNYLFCAQSMPEA
jgi:FkbM family methyltransferase